MKLVFIIILLLTGCETGLKSFGPKANDFVDQGMRIKGMPKEWYAGYQDGCESGYSAYGNDYYKTFYKFRRDPKLSKYKYYDAGWRDAFNYCRHALGRHLIYGLYSTNIEDASANQDYTFRSPLTGYSLRNEATTGEDRAAIVGNGEIPMYVDNLKDGWWGPDGGIAGGSVGGKAFWDPTDNEPDTFLSVGQTDNQMGNFLMNGGTYGNLNGF
jgi:hypothetical protein